MKKLISKFIILAIVRVSFRNFLAEKELVETLRNYVKNYPARSN